MGAGWYAKAAIGCKVPKENLYITARVRVCAHPLPDPAMAYCPSCGKPGWQVRRNPIDGYDDGEETGRAMLRGFPVATGTNGTGFVVVCLKGCLAEAGHEEPHRAALPGDMDAAEHDLRAMLEPLGLWDDKAFGLWSILYCSC